MVISYVVATPVINDAKAAHKKANTIGVALYHSGSKTLPGLGARLTQAVVKSFPAPPSQTAWDFLSLALAIFSADRFVLRRDADDGWTRVISLDVAIFDPKPWKSQLSALESALRFLTGDIWKISIRSGGAKVPSFASTLSDRDSICLFSGGLDSLLGALHLVNSGKTPFLVSQGSPKEIQPQLYLANKLKLDGGFRFEGRVSEKWVPPYEGSTRARSIIFFAYGVAAATAHGLSELFVPENGLIAINPPFSPRRIGSLSTRTTHPYFLNELENILQNVGINVKLTNPFEGKTKGEMILACKSKGLESLLSASYSCGKGKRLNGQCGLCVPCLIRRAAFYKSGIKDRSLYKKDIKKSKRNDDVLAARLASARMKKLTVGEISRWVNTAGPLPKDPKRRKNIISGVIRGMKELGEFLDDIKWR